MVPDTSRGRCAIKRFKRPTDAELSILHVLWERGPSTVRDVLERLQEKRGWGYTTVLKLLQIMYEKGLVRRDTKRQSHRYWASVSQEATQKSFVNDLVDRAFNNSPHKLVMHALADHKATPEELAELRKLLKELARRSK